MVANHFSFARTVFGNAKMSCQRPVPGCYKLAQLASDESQHVSTRQSALTHINQALSIDPKNATFWYKKADILTSLEEDEEALPCAEKALQLDPKLGAAWTVKANALCNMGKGAEALVAINKALSITNDPANHLAKASILLNLQKPEAAEKELDDLVKLAPTNTLYRGRRASLASKLKHWDRVISDCTFLINNNKQVNLSHLQHIEMRAGAYAGTKQYDRAIVDYKNALKLVPDKRDLHDGLLNVYRLSGQTRAQEREAAILKRIDNDLKPMK